MARQAERSGRWPTLSRDPVIQWCLEEALAARLQHERNVAEQRAAATETALTKARAEVKQAVGR